MRSPHLQRAEEAVLKEEGHRKVDRIGRRDERRRSSVGGGPIEQEQCHRQHCENIYITHTCSSS
jgi:hypothetical protein